MKATDPKPKTVRFGPFELDGVAAELRKRGVTLKLQPQPFQVLSILVGRAGELVTREELREALWPEDTFVEFDHSLNTAVRKIRQTLDDSAQEPQYLETCPRKGYRFIASVQADGAERIAAGVEEQSPSRRWSLVAGVGLAIGAVLLAAGIVPSVQGPPDSAVAAIPLTTYPGSEHAPSFSPDGSQVAFAWCREGDCGIYIKQIGVDEPFLFADGPDKEISPAWSPDGSQIAFVRTSAEKQSWQIVVAPQRGGGPEKVLSELKIPLYLYQNSRRYLDWHPSGQWLATMGERGLLAIGLESGDTKPLTGPPPGVMDFAPSISANGRTLAFNRDNGGVLVQELKGREVYGEPMGILETLKVSGSPVWIPGRKEIVLTRGYAGLWLVNPSKPSQSHRLSAQGSSIETAAVSNRGDLVYAAVQRDMNIWRLELPDQGGQAFQAEPLISSTQWDLNPSYSPDGTRIVFTSLRSGSPEIWIADRDGRNQRAITSFGGSWTADPRWSPDSQKVAFYSYIDGRKSAFVVSIHGETPRQIGRNPANENEWPVAWSEDGLWIYLRSSRGPSSFAGSRGKLWRAPASGKGQPQQLTTSDLSERQILAYGLGRTLDEDAQRAAGLEDVDPTSRLEVFDDGFYYIANPDDDGTSAIRFLDFAKGRATTIGRTTGEAGYWSLSVSSDRRSILWAQVDRTACDLMLVKNFR